MLEKVLNVPLMVLFLKISVVSFATSVSVALGTVSVPDAAVSGVNVVLPLVLPLSCRFAWLCPPAPIDTSVAAFCWLRRTMLLPSRYATSPDGAPLLVDFRTSAEFVAEPPVTAGVTTEDVVMGEIVSPADVP